MQAYMIIDGQWGSTGKGLIAGKLALDLKPDAVACNFGPNAGHTWIGDDGQKIMTCQLPTAAFMPGVDDIFIGPGAIINFELLMKEIQLLSFKIRNESTVKRIHIHESAALVADRHITHEMATMGHISSTQKGVGMALIGKIMRQDPDAMIRAMKNTLPSNAFAGVQIVSEDVYRSRINSCKLVQIESAQGMDLSLNRGVRWPYVTSRDITPEQVLSDVGISHHDLISTYASIRTFPIRVGHMMRDGSKIGDSGPFYPDQVELTWGELDIIPERTTVTNKVRRIFSFSGLQFCKMLEIFKPDNVFLNFVNYISPDAKRPEELNDDAVKFIQRLNTMQKSNCSMISHIGLGPRNDQVFEVKYGEI